MTEQLNKINSKGTRSQQLVLKLHTSNFPCSAFLFPIMSAYLYGLGLSSKCIP